MLIDVEIFCSVTVFHFLSCGVQHHIYKRSKSLKQVVVLWYRTLCAKFEPGSESWMLIEDIHALETGFIIRLEGS